MRMKVMTGDVLFSNMLFRCRVPDFAVGVKMPDSPDSLIKNQITSSASNGLPGMNGSHSPHPPGDTPSPPVTSPSTVPHHLDMPGGNSNSSRGKHVIKVKRFLATLQQFATDMSVDIGERVHSLIIGLVSSSVSIEDFHHKIQEITNYPLRPFAIPFLKSHLPLLQTELLHFSRLAKLSPQQYLRQNEHLILDAAPSQQPSFEPFDLYPAEAKENTGTKRRSPSTRNGKTETDYTDTNGDGPPPAKRHHPLPSPTLGHRTSPVAGLPPGLSTRVPDSDHVYRMERYDRFDREFYRPFYGNVQVRDYPEDRDMDEEWRNIHTMLNCILGMVEKTKRALCILQHRSYSERAAADLSGWIRHAELDHKKPRSGDLVSHLKIAEDRVSEVRRRAEEAVNEVKRQAVVELQKAVTAAEAKASELVASERIKMERLLAEARRQAAEDAMAAVTHQEESTENRWNFDRNVNNTVSECNVTRYCDSSCQHRDWESHHRGFEKSSSNHTFTSSSTLSPRTNSDPSPSSSRTSTLVDIKPININCNCWNCGRKANETCSGCNVARYCGSFCQHKDWESHHRVCGQSSSNHPSTSTSSTPPRTNSDHSPSPSRTSTLVDIKPIKIDTM